MNPNHHSAVHFGRGTDEKPAAFLEVEQGVAQRLTGGHGDQNPVLAPAEIARGFGAIAFEGVVHQARPGRCREKFGAKADQPPGRDEIIETQSALAVRDHFAQFTAALSEFFHDGALVLVLEIDGQHFPGLADLAVDRFQNDFGAGDRELEALAPHRLDKNG